MIEYTVRVREDGTKYWFLNGKSHREDGPAIEYASGTKYWFLNGNLHREDGPAIELPDGTKQWRFNGNLHREDGPAVELPDGTKEWWLDDEELTEEEWRAKVQPQPSCDGKVVEIDGKKYKLTEVL